jgi:anti-sigma-K factor RskA
MADRLSHEEVRKLLGAYALDAVALEEREALERHLAGCGACRQEVAEHRETAALLASAGEPAPGRVWDRIAASLEERPVSLDDRRRGMPGRWLAAAAAAAAVAIVAMLGVRVVDQGHRLDSAQQRQAALEGAVSALSDPHAQVVELRSAGAGVSAVAVMLPNGEGYLVRDTLEALPRDRTYQLWAFVGQEPVSAGVLGPNPGISSFRAPAAADGLAITDERAPGASAPGSPPLVIGDVETR